jgi:hypothetical protein
MKHGMLTVRPGADDGADDGAGHDGHGAPAGHDAGGDSAGHDGSHDQSAGGQDEHGGGQRPGPGTIVVVTVFTFAALAAGLWVAGGFFV